MPRALNLDFHYDISCPFAYIASLRLPSLQLRHPSLTINYRPVLLGALYRATSAPQGAAGSASDTFNPTKRSVTSAAFARTLRRLNIEHRQPPHHPVKTTKALRLLFCVEGKERIALTKGLYRAYWVEGGNVSEAEVLRSVVSRCDDLTQLTRDRLLSLLSSGEFESAAQRKALEESTQVALQRGAFGVPAFWILEEGRLYWGQDRMQFLEKALFEMETSQEQVLESLMPRCVPVPKRAISRDEEVRLEFWYDFSSPWAFLGWTQLARLQRIFGPGLTIEMKPFLLGILFREYVTSPITILLTIAQRSSTGSVHPIFPWLRYLRPSESTHSLTIGTGFNGGTASITKTAGQIKT